MKIAWVNGVETCPDNNEYGQLVVKVANVYISLDLGTNNYANYSIPHGEQVEILKEFPAEEVAFVRYNNMTGYVQSMLLVDYNPHDGFQPNPDNCI